MKFNNGVLGNCRNWSGVIMYVCIRDIYNHFVGYSFGQIEPVINKYMGYIGVGIIELYNIRDKLQICALNYLSEKVRGAYINEMLKVTGNHCH